MSLSERLAGLATAPRLTVVCDFDGTLAPLVDDPSQVAADPRAVAALVELGAMTGTRVVILSGRSLVTLRRLAGSIPGVQLIGSHGAETTETDPHPSPSLSQALESFGDLVTRYPAAGLEHKPFGLAFHYRRVERELKMELEEVAVRVASRFEEFDVIVGKDLVELVVPGSGKGEALRRLRATHGGAILFGGDDVTDEHGFEVLEPGDVGIKVGDGPSAAEFRVETVDDVAAILQDLARRRAGR